MKIIKTFFFLKREIDRPMQTDRKYNILKTQVAARGNEMPEVQWRANN